VKILDFAPHSRGTLTRECLIFLRGCGPDAGRGRDADCSRQGRKGCGDLLLTQRSLRARRDFRFQISDFRM